MKHPNTIAIVGGGRLSKQLLPEIIKSNYVIGVDRGAYWLIVNGVIPNIAIGDFDSVSTREFQMINNNVKRVKEYPKKKNFTDMELAVDHAIKFKPKEVVIYGAVGSRLDHTIGNIQLLERLRGVGVIRDRNNEVRIISGRITMRKDARYQYFSVLSVTETIEVSLTGFAYDVSHALIRRGQTLGVSNEIKGVRATIDVHLGRALVIRSRD
ncbi:thiamine diphosphokinase [Candidatus Gottesmanbacteria bacterium]|nr:thiamine diphosphokinase [Candidatus Gottesmanbacteria bacterium]